MSLCMCGAIDCRRCYPGNFDKGMYLETTCPECDCDWFAENARELEDSGGVCRECRCIEEPEPEPEQPPPPPPHPCNGCAYFRGRDEHGRGYCGHPALRPSPCQAARLPDGVHEKCNGLLREEKTTTKGVKQ